MLHQQWPKYEPIMAIPISRYCILTFLVVYLFPFPLILSFNMTRSDRIGKWQNYCETLCRINLSHRFHTWVVWLTEYDTASIGLYAQELKYIMYIYVPGMSYDNGSETVSVIKWNRRKQRRN